MLINMIHLTPEPELFHNLHNTGLVCYAIRLRTLCGGNKQT